MNTIEKAASRLGTIPGWQPRNRAHLKEVDGDKGTKQPRVHTEQDGSTVNPVVQSRPKLQALGTPAEADFLDLAKKGFLTPNNSLNGAENEFRVIKRPLLENALGPASNLVEHGRRLMVTSSLAGEGKTFTAVNLAMSVAAERDCSVVLIDGDVLLPSVHEILGVSQTPGVTDWLTAGGGDIEPLIHPTKVPNLWVIPAGAHHDQATELIASSAMDNLFQLLTDDDPNRILIIDSPPLLTSTVGRVLASKVGQVLIVVEEARTTHESVAESISVAGNAVVNLVLNKSKSRPRKGYEQYGPRPR